MLIYKWAGLALLLLTAQRALPSTPVTAFRPGDRIAFMGDSITIKRNYTLTVERYLRSRYPAYALQFYNAGVSGDNVKQSLDASYCTSTVQAVIDLRADVVSINYGMNDSGYGWGGSSTFSADYQTLINRLRAGLPTSRLLILSNGTGDASAIPNWHDEGNASCGGKTPQLCPNWMAPSWIGDLQTFAGYAQTVAASNGLPFWNVFNTMTAMKSLAQAAHPRYQITVDGIHPDQAGGLPYAYGWLKAAGVPPRTDRIDLSAPNAVTGSGGATVSNFSCLNGGIGYRFDLSLAEAPYVHLPGATKGLPFIPAFQRDLNWITFTASGLNSASSYYLVIDGYRSGPVAVSQLAAGINLADSFSNSAPAQSQAAFRVELLDASAISTPPAHDVVLADFENWDEQVRDWCASLSEWGGRTSLSQAFELPFGNSINSGASACRVCSTTAGGLGAASPGANGSRYCARIAGACSVLAKAPNIYIDADANYADTKDGIRFAFKAAAGTQYRVAFKTMAELDPASGACNPKALVGCAGLTDNIWKRDYSLTFTATSTWTTYYVPYSALSQMPVAPASGERAYPFDKREIAYIRFMPASTGAFDFSVDDVAFASAQPESLTPFPTCQAVSPSPTLTPSRSASSTKTLTSSPSATSTATVTPSTASSGTPSTPPVPTVSFTPTATPTASVTAPASATVTPTVTLTLTTTAAPSPVPTSSGKAPNLLAAEAYPNPLSGARLSLAFLLEGPADSLLIKLYSKAMILIERHQVTASLTAGWNRSSVPIDPPLSNGLYYVVLEAKGAAGTERSRLLKVIYLN